MRLMTVCAAMLGIAFVMLTSAGTANAQATRTWISGVGDDANPCSRTAPCKTFPGAISKTAAGGEIDCLDPGGFGTVTITKAITLDCNGWGSILSSGVNGIIISSALPAGASVTIRNLSINGAVGGLSGIRWLASSGALHVENVQIFGFTTNGIDFENTASANLFVRNSQISDNPGGGILVKPSGGVLANVSVYQSKLDRNLFGLRVEDGGKATVQDTIAQSNNGNGYLAVGVSVASEINLVRSVAANTFTNGVATSGALATINVYYCAITDNGTGVNATAGGTIATTAPSTNLVVGNGAPGAFTSTVSLQ